MQKRSIPVIPVDKDVGVLKMNMRFKMRKSAKSLTMTPEKEVECSIEKTLPFAMKHLPGYFKEKAKRELNETPENRIKSLEELKEMAKNHKLTCDIQFVDDFLLQFLRQRKYDVSRALKQLVNFTNFRNNYSSYFLSIDSNIFFSDPRKQFCTILPRRCPDGCTIFLLELGKWDPDVITFPEFRQIMILLVIQALRDPMTQINGFKIVYDFTGSSLKHVRYCTPTNSYLLYHGGMECFPGRYKAIHLVNDSLIMKTVWKVVSPFLSGKLKQRIFLNPSRTDLLNHFPPDVLPTQYGGLLEDYHATEWMRLANKQQEGFTLRGQCNYY